MGKARRRTNDDEADESLGRLPYGSGCRRPSLPRTPVPRLPRQLLARRQEPSRTAATSLPTPPTANTKVAGPFETGLDTYAPVQGSSVERGRVGGPASPCPNASTTSARDSVRLMPLSLASTPIRAQAVANRGARLHRLDADAALRQFVGEAAKGGRALQIDPRRRGKVEKHQFRRRGFRVDPREDRVADIVDIEIEQTRLRAGRSACRGSVRSPDGARDPSSAGSRGMRPSNATCGLEAAAEQLHQREGRPDHHAAQQA